jgi:hypothetical protein
MTDPMYKIFTALDPFFGIVQQGLAGLVDATIILTRLPTTRSLSIDIFSLDILRGLIVAKH